MEGVFGVEKGQANKFVLIFTTTTNISLIMSDKELEEFGGLSREAARAMGFGRARALAVALRKRMGKSLPTDPEITDDDLRCDAEQVSVDESGNVTKSDPR